MVERIEYDEFSYFHENAEEFGLAYPQAPIVNRVSVELDDGRIMSALVWGSAEPELVLIHGGAQNAHTWDTVALALGRPLVAIDMPGHGHSDGPAEDGLSATDLAKDVAQMVRALAPRAQAIVGMSLGGLTSIALTGIAPDLVRSLVLVDVTPGVDGEKSKAITAFVNGPKTFPSFDEILARTVEHNSTRTEASLRRGILHNAVQLDDGSWVWRYQRHAGGLGTKNVEEENLVDRFAGLWELVGKYANASLLVRGMRPQSVVDDADEELFRATAVEGSVIRVEEAGHSLQGDTPVEFAQILDDFLAVRFPDSKTGS